MSRIFWKRVISGKQLMEGYRIPRGWGVSYVKWESDHSVIHPIPLNYIIAGMRWLLHKMSVPYFLKLEKEQLTTEHLLGWHEGWEEHKRYVEQKEDQHMEEGEDPRNDRELLGFHEHARRVLEKVRKDKEKREHEEAKHLNEKNKSNGL